VGALHCILPPANLRPYLIHAVECGIQRDLEAHSAMPPVPETSGVADPEPVS